MCCRVDIREGGCWYTMKRKTYSYKRILSQKIQQSEGRARGLKIFSLFRVKKRGAWGDSSPQQLPQAKANFKRIFVSRVGIRFFFSWTGCHRYACTAQPYIGAGRCPF